MTDAYTVVGRTKGSVAVTGPTDYSTVAELYDEFDTDNLGNGLAGRLLWRRSGTTFALGATAPGEVGVFRANGTSLGLHIGFHKLDLFHTDDLFDFSFLLWTDQPTDSGDFAIGVTDGAVTALNLGMVFRSLVTDSPRNWYAVSKAGTGTTSTDTGVPWAVDTKFLMRIRRIDASTVGFTINGGTEITHTTNNPSMAAGIIILGKVTTSTVEVSMIVDTFWGRIALTRP